MRIAVIGAGAIGSLFGGLLARGGHDVLFVARGATLTALRDRGLRVESPAGDFSIEDVDVTDDTTVAGPVDAILVCVKAWQVPQVAETLAPLVGAKTVVIPTQNGVEAAEQLSGALGVEHVIGGTCKVICKLAAPGHVVHVGVAPQMEIGELEGPVSERVTRLAEMLDAAGLGGRAAENIHVAVWEKFLFVTPVGGLGAVTRVDVGTLRAHPETRSVLRQAMEEIREVARARGIEVRADIVERMMRFLDGLPAEGTASMQRDIIEGRPSELDSQNGAVVRLAERAGLDVPVHRFIHACLTPLERRARGQSAPAAGEAR